MKRRAWVREHAGRFALTLLLLCLIVYTVYHAFRGSSGSLLTSPAREITDTRLLGGEAWLFREEQLLLSDRDGLVNPIAKSGEKVAKNSALAELWHFDASTGLAERQGELDDLNRVIGLLENSLPPFGSSLSDAYGYRTDALATLAELRQSLRDGNWSAVGELEERMLVLLNRYGALTEGEEPVREALKRAKADREALFTGEVTTLYSGESSAYFYDRSCVDGMETVFTKEALTDLTVEGFAALREAKSEEIRGCVAGKLCYRYEWHLALELTDGGADFLEEGIAYSFRFPENGGVTLQLTCEKILVDGATSVVVFRSNDTPTGFRYLRSQRVEITVGSVSGYYVPEQTLVHLNANDGVYVFEDSTVRFRRIEVIYRGEGYVIASKSDPAPEQELGYLGANDLVITSGKNLYDGKVYR